MKEYHSKRFLEVYETVKRIDYDEWHRTQGSALVRAQAELDVREGRKHNVQLGFASQRLSDMGDGRDRAIDRPLRARGSMINASVTRSSSASASPRPVRRSCAIG